MGIQENDIGLVSYDEFNEHQTNSDEEILHVTKTEKDEWNGKAKSSDLKAHKEAAKLDHPDGSVTTDKIANEAVTESKLSSGLQNKITAHDTHAKNTNNPHQTSKSQVGLGNVDNVKQASKTEFDAHKNNSVLAHPDGSVTYPKLGDDVKEKIAEKIDATQIPVTVSVEGTLLMPVTFVDIDKDGNAVINENGGGDYLLAIGANGKPYIAETYRSEIAALKAKIDLLYEKSLTKITTITLLASAWKQKDEKRYFQIISMPEVTPTSKIGIQLTPEQITIFKSKDITFVAENDGGVVKMYCIGQKPTADYTLQATITEVTTNG